MSISFYASDKPLLSLSLERTNDEGEDDRAGVVEMLSALSVLSADWLAPLGVGLQFCWCDPENFFEHAGKPERAHQLLHVRDVPLNVDIDPAFSDSVVDVLSDLSASAIASAVERGLALPAPAGLVTSLSAIQWTAVRARSPLGELIELLAPTPSATVSEAIQGARWCYGPTSYGIAGPPVLLRVMNSHFSTEIVLEVFWDLWVGYPAGRALLDAGVSRVLDRGGWILRQDFPRP